MGDQDAFEDVLAAMQGAEDPAQRISIIRAAGFCRDRRCFPALLAAISDPDPEVQGEAAISLSRFNRPDDVAAMVAMIESGQTTPRQRRLLFAAFGQGLAISATPILIKGLRDPDQDTCRAAAQALEAIAGRTFGLDHAHWEKWWRVNAGRTREDILDERLAVLTDALRARSDELSRLADQQAELMELLRLPLNGEPAPLLKALSSQHDPVREYASIRLATLNSETLKGAKLETRDYAALRHRMADASVQVRRNLIRFIVRLAGPERDELLRMALSDQDQQVLITAINAAGADADGAALASLAQLLGHSPHQDVREAAANQLGKIGSKDSVPALVAALADDAANVRWFAVEGLNKLAAVETAARIADLLENDPSPRVREIAASALGALGQPASAVALRKALDDENERVRGKAVLALLALATDNYERMSVIAGYFAELDLHEPAKQVLNRIIEQFAGSAEMQDHVVEAHRKLAAILKLQKDYAGAAKVCEKLLALVPGEAAVRRDLIHCWTQAGEPQRIIAAFDQWLAAPEAAEASVELALDAAETLAQNDKTRQAAEALLALAAKKVGEEGDERLKNRIARLREQLGG
jgi:HEAT repeat protein